MESLTKLSYPISPGFQAGDKCSAAMWTSSVLNERMLFRAVRAPRTLKKARFPDY